MKNLGIYGGTFNPPHRGHVKAAAEFCRFVNADLLLVIPNADPPLKEKYKYITANDRLEAVKLAFENEKIQAKVKVSDYEIKAGGVSYTYKTLREIKKRYPDSKLYMLIGTDQLFIFEKWKNFCEIAQSVTLCVAVRERERESEAFAAAKKLRESCGADVRLLPMKAIEISSGEIRRAFAAGESEKIEKYLDPEVFEYIKKKELYLK